MEKVRKRIELSEVRDLAIVIALATLIFSFPIQGLNFLGIFVIILLSISLRYAAHKLMADRLGCMATFKLWLPGVAIGLLSLLLKSILGFVFLGLGYVEIIPYKFGRWGIKLIKMTPRDYAYIALAGVGVNLFLMTFFGVAYTINHIEIFQIISKINGILAFFGLLPMPPLEGGHVFTWSIWFWVFLMFFTILTLVAVHLP